MIRNTTPFDDAAHAETRLSDPSSNRTAPNRARTLNKRGRTRRALSMVEVVAVVVIAGITGAIAIPRYQSSLNHFRLDAAAKRIEADFEMISEIARTERTSYTLIFDPDTENYGVAGITSLDRRSANYQVDLSDPPYHANIVSADFATAQQVVIDEFGRPTESGSVIVEVNGVQRTIKINASAGAAEVDDS